MELYYDRDVYVKVPENFDRFCDHLRLNSQQKDYLDYWRKHLTAYRTVREAENAASRHLGYIVRIVPEEDLEFSMIFIRKTWFMRLRLLFGAI